MLDACIQFNRFTDNPAHQEYLHDALEISAYLDKTIQAEFRHMHNTIADLEKQNSVIVKDNTKLRKKLAKAKKKDDKHFPQPPPKESPVDDYRPKPPIPYPLREFPFMIDMLDSHPCAGNFEPVL